ncbi:hypothetical protein F8388_008214 [Cannabis sativa]|uniref:Uncharacterized protein n=1 Tax=Cannabis sativa TaxID=3483 RepID=A0A7J6HA22_CANSA|nr:hypothetical protein F8388_008214 [Cannabis sativa]KAF4391329.1 hypothetical protein G4B88_016639 [Cannabis sativa]
MAETCSRTQRSRAWEMSSSTAESSVSERKEKSAISKVLVQDFRTGKCWDECGKSLDLPDLLWNLLEKEKQRVLELRKDGRVLCHGKWEVLCLLWLNCAWHTREMKWVPSSSIAPVPAPLSEHSTPTLSSPAVETELLFSEQYSTVPVLLG